MKLKEFKTYLTRPFEQSEKNQIKNFTKLKHFINGKIKLKPEGMISGFLSKQEDNYTTQILEDKMKYYYLFRIFDLIHRKTNNINWCFIPKHIANKKGIQNSHNIYIEFSKFKKQIIKYKDQTEKLHFYPSVILDEFQIISPIKQRLISRKNMIDTLKLRKYILTESFPDISSNVKQSIISTQFLCPRIYGRAGIEGKSLLSEKINPRELINLDELNNLNIQLVPPEVSNYQKEIHRGYELSYFAKNINAKIPIHIDIPNKHHEFETICAPNQIQSQKSILRSISKSELGIHHQSKINAFPTKKEILDKIINTEFIYLQPELPKYKINKYTALKKLINSERENLNSDYAARLMIPIKPTPLSISEKHLIKNQTNIICEILKYTPKQQGDSYSNSISRALSYKLSRVKSIISRSGLGGASAPLIYLKSNELNFQEIIDSTYFQNLPENKSKIHWIRKIMNNPLRSLIVSNIKTYAGLMSFDKLLKECIELGHDVKNVIKELNNLSNAKIIYKIGDNIIMDTKEI